MTSPQTVDAYIGSFPEDVQTRLRTLREIIRQVAPAAEASISYGIPAFRVNGTYFVYIAGWKQHLSLYPIPVVDGALAEELAPYRGGKGTLRFKLGEPLPADVVERVVRLLLEQRAVGAAIAGGEDERRGVRGMG